MKTQKKQCLAYLVFECGSWNNPVLIAAFNNHKDAVRYANEFPGICRVSMPSSGDGVVLTNIKEVAELCK